MTLLYEHRTILNKLKVKTRLSNVYLRRMLDYFGNIGRKNANSIEELMVTGSIERNTVP